MEDSSARGKIRTTVIDSHSRPAEMISRLVKSEPLLHLTGTHTQESSGQLTKLDLSSHQVVIMYETQAASQIDIIKKYPEINFIITGPHWPGTYEHAVRQLHQTTSLMNAGLGNVTRFAYIDPIEKNHQTNVSNFRKHIDNLRNRGCVSRQLSVGIVGMGKFGHNIMREIMGESWTSRVLVHSNYFKDQDVDKMNFKTITQNATGGNKVQGIKYLDELLKEDPDVLLITTGPYNASYEMSREEFVKEQLIPTWRKNEQIFREIEKSGYGGLIGVLSHPPGAYLSLAHRRHGIPAGQLTSFSSDQARAQTQVFQHIMNKLQMQRTAHQHHRETWPIDVWGEHGERACISWEGIWDSKSPLVPTPEERETIEMKVREAGKEVMAASNESGINYFDVPQAVKQCLRNLSTYKTNPDFAWYTQVNEEIIDSLARAARRKLSPEVRADYEKAFLMLPVGLSYPQLRVSLGESVTPSAMNMNLKKRLYDCIAAQSERVKLCERELAK